MSVMALTSLSHDITMGALVGRVTCKAFGSRDSQMLCSSASLKRCPSWPDYVTIADLSSQRTVNHATVLGARANRMGGKWSMLEFLVDSAPKSMKGRENR